MPFELLQMAESAPLLLRQAVPPVHEPNRATAAAPVWAPSFVVVFFAVMLVFVVDLKKIVLEEDRNI